MTDLKDCKIRNLALERLWRWPYGGFFPTINYLINKTPIF